jgi:hypothetical protein
VYEGGGGGLEEVSQDCTNVLGHAVLAAPHGKPVHLDIQTKSHLQTFKIDNSPTSERNGGRDLNEMKT